MSGRDCASWATTPERRRRAPVKSLGGGLHGRAAAAGAGQLARDLAAFVDLELLQIDAVATTSHGRGSCPPTVGCSRAWKSCRISRRSEPWCSSGVRVSEGVGREQTVRPRTIPSASPSREGPLTPLSHYQSTPTTLRRCAPTVDDAPLLAMAPRSCAQSRRPWPISSGTSKRSIRSMSSPCPMAIPAPTCWPRCAQPWPQAETLPEQERSLRQVADGAAPGCPHGRAWQQWRHPVADHPGHDRWRRRRVAGPAASTSPRVFVAARMWPTIPGSPASDPAAALDQDRPPARHRSRYSRRPDFQRRRHASRRQGPRQLLHRRRRHRHHGDASRRHDPGRQHARQHAVAHQGREDGAAVDAGLLPGDGRRAEPAASGSAPRRADGRDARRRRRPAPGDERAADADRRPTCRPTSAWSSPARPRS